MASQVDHSNLAKIGSEAFSALDKYLGRPNKRLGRPSPHHQAGYLVNQPFPSTPVIIDSNEAAQRYGGKVYTDYPKGKTIRRPR
ncbi:conserved hypothetical protein [Ricinus communis]|uniref:Uncharacterized protein n=1 Tax=Ricinus communis TaxID=3988 RepID=B9RT96_RICCO|nr:conserved hypothetical protein [Ricinus communis]